MTFIDILKQDHFTLLVQHPHFILSDGWNPQILTERMYPVHDPSPGHAPFHVPHPGQHQLWKGTTSRGIGIAFESCVTTKYPEVAPSTTGQLKPVFMHCKGSRCFKDRETGSKRSPDPVKAAFDFLCNFVQTNPAVDSSKILTLSSHGAMIETITSILKWPEYSAI